MRGWIAIALALMAGSATAQNPAGAGPGAVVLAPIEYIGVVPEQRAQVQRQLNQGWDALRAQVLPGAAPIAQAWAPRIKTQNMTRLAAKHWIAPANAQPEQVTQLLQPTLCNFDGHYVVLVQKMSWPQEIVLASAHRLVERRVDPKGRPDAALAEQWREMLLAAGREALAGPDAPLASELLKISTRDHIGLTRLDQGPSRCLSLMVEGELARQFTVTSSLATFHAAHLRRMGERDLVPTKSTRHVAWSWDLGPEQRIQRWTLPLSVQAKVDISESVFGSASEPPLPVTLQAAVQNNRIALQGLEPLIATLQKHVQMLVAADEPLVAKVYGAWAYLDKGLAHGLRMKDRLLAQGPNGPIKGHVVAYYGPEQALKSPRGFPISEGAILYIRRGQADVRVGQEFRYDMLQFPTPWPPQP